MDHFTMAISLFLHICFFLLLFCQSSGRRTLEAEDESFHESPDDDKFQQRKRESVSKALSQNETVTTSHFTKHEMTSKVASIAPLPIVEITEQYVLINQDNATVATFTPTTSYIMPLDKSSADIQSEKSTHDASVHSKSTSILSTQLSTVSMSNSSTQNTIIETKATSLTSTLLKVPATTTDTTFKNHVTSVATFVPGQTPTTTMSMTTETTRQEVKEETAFGRYGLLTFGITIALVLILVFALIFVLTRRRKKCRPVTIQDEDISPRLRMLEVPGLGEGKDDGLQTYSLGYDNGNNRISVRPPG
ncbi:hypothetical protein ACJMK2_008230 [Sinanodonta woodiana]|uniref:Uncharacterized protein n=3 Tax=Sinanodonta woodiana TaxID=1069815 RepID=A0ABD3VLT2_SINWO